MTAIFTDNSGTTNHIPVEDMTDITCPKCGTNKVEGQFVETGDGVAIQQVRCSECDVRWENVYDFSAVYLIDEGEDGLLIEIPREDVKKVEGSTSDDESMDVLRKKMEELRVVNEDFRFELEVAYGLNADLERRIVEMQNC